MNNQIDIFGNVGAENKSNPITVEKALEVLKREGYYCFKSAISVQTISDGQSSLRNRFVTKKAPVEEPLQIDIVKKHLELNKSITSWEAIQAYRITRLSHYIYLLRNAGYSIDSQKIVIGKKNFVKYILVTNG